MYWWNKILQKKIVYGNVTKENINKHNPNWPLIFHYLYRLLIIGGSGYEKTNALLNLIKQPNDNDYNIFDKIHLYVIDPNEAKYQYLIEKHKEIFQFVLKSMKIERLLLNIKIISKISIKILKRTI